MRNCSAPGPVSDMESLPSGVKLSKPRSQRHFRGHTADVSTLVLTYVRCAFHREPTFCLPGCFCRHLFVSNSQDPRGHVSNGSIQ
jgi:hypothetical protein